LANVQWGEFTFNQIFNKIAQGRRLKKDDQTQGKIPFVMAGVTNTGIVNYVSNPVARFPKNSITVDIFGNVFYRDYSFGAGDDTGVYWNDEIEYSRSVMLFFSIAMQSSLRGKFSYGKKLRSSQSFNFVMKLPTKKGKVDYDFIEYFIAELEAERVAELEAERVAELEAYLSAAGLKEYTLTPAEQQVLDNFDKMKFTEFRVVDIFDVKNTRNILARDIAVDSGETPYLCASAMNNAVSSYITYDESFIDKGNCVFIGGKTFIVTYQEKDFYSNDSHNLVLYLKNEAEKTKLNQLYLATCINKSLRNKYSWGDSISNRKIQNDKVSLPVKHNKPDFKAMETFITAIQKLVIKDVVHYSNRKIAATKYIIKSQVM
jgi:hypothetical protein